jgi:predicted nucleotidyltransferase
MTFFKKSEYVILKLIYEKPGIILSELMKKAKVSAATLKKRINAFIEREIIIEKKIVGGRRVILKNFYPNIESETSRCAFSLIELEKKYEFLYENKKLIGPLKQLAANIKEIDVILVFGSFANYSQTSDSDLDILLLASKMPEKNFLKKEIERSFVTFEHQVSPRIDTIKNFKKNKDNSIYQTIIKNHVIIKGAEKFIALA